MKDLLVWDVRYSEEPIDSMHDLHEALAGCPYDIRDTKEKVMVLHTSQLKALRLEIFEKWGSEYEAKHWLPEKIAGFKLVVTNETDGEYCPKHGCVH